MAVSAARLPGMIWDQKGAREANWEGQGAGSQERPEQS